VINSVDDALISVLEVSVCYVALFCSSHSVLIVSLQCKAILCYQMLSVCCLNVTWRLCQ